MAAPAVPLTLLAAASPRAVDVLGLLLLLAFTWWGARKGALRQALSLLVLGGAFAAAGHWAAAVEPTVAKLFDLGPGERLAAAWAGLLFGALVLGALAIRLLGARLPERSRSDAERVVGGLLGAAKGAVVLTLVGYLSLATAGVWAAPALSRPAAARQAEEPGPVVHERVRGSLSAVCLEEWGGLLRRVVAVPPWIARHIEAVNRGLRAEATEVDAPARPRGR